MIVLDANSGKMLAGVAIGRGVDGVAYEPTLGVAMSANGRDGTLSVVKETSAGTFEVIDTPKTLNGADDHRGYREAPCPLAVQRAGWKGRPNIRNRGGRRERGGEEVERSAGTCNRT